MSPAARSVFAFGVYLGAGGIALMFLPHRLCDTFGLRSPGDTLWVRVCGALLVDLAHYCIRAARNGHIRFIRWTVPPRLLTLPILGVVVASDLENASILVFGVIDALAALWTLFALPRRGPALNVLTRPLSLRHGRRRHALEVLDQFDHADRAEEQARMTPHSADVGGVVCKTAGRYGP